jgi:hypothetical protein
MKWGTTFSLKYARDLGLDWRTVFQRILEEFNFASIRLCAYWDLVEPKQGKLDFADLDWQVEQAAKHNLEITLAIGRKVPRWPEYHDPAWALARGSDCLNQAVFDYIEQVVRRYDHHPKLVQWQVENEPFYDFGATECKLDQATFLHEISLVQSLSNKPIVLTESGERREWFEAAQYADRLGINLYRIWYDTADQAYKTYDYDSTYYRRKKDAVPCDTFVAELQAEPWGPRHIAEESIVHEWTKSMDPDKLRTNVQLALNAGFTEIWFWGCEWWLAAQRKGLDMVRAVQEFMEQS